MHIYIDEAGRGPLAGPVYVGACFFDGDKKKLSDYDDSKKLTSRQRDILYEKIQQRSDLIVATGRASAKEIDRFGIIIALRRATRRALKKLAKNMSFPNNHEMILVMDGNHSFGLEQYGYKIQTIIKGDSLIREIGVASITAKVERDREMIRHDRRYPLYGFAHHKWYGTAMHREMIEQYGTCDIHRETFCRNIVGEGM